MSNDRMKFARGFENISPVPHMVMRQIHMYKQGTLTEGEDLYS
jgi:hypothetical protein